MHFPRILITLLAMIAQAHCGTLRQYGRDWLIPKPEPQVGAKRITAKSVFITPNLQPNVRCNQGYQEDSSGRCVKLVHVNQVAQLDFLLQRLNAVYGASNVSHSEKQPLQVAVDIPVEPTDPHLLEEMSKPQKGEEMYNQPQPTPVENPDLPHFYDEDLSEENGTDEKGNIEESITFVDEDITITNDTSVVIDGNKETQNMTSTIVVPDDSGDYFEEDPIVVIKIVDDDGNVHENHTIVKIAEHLQASNNSTKIIVGGSVSVMDESFDVEDLKNKSLKIVKKETAVFDNSTQDVPPTLTDLGLISQHAMYIGTPVGKTNDSETLPFIDNVDSENDEDAFTSLPLIDKVEDGDLADDQFIDGVFDETGNEIKSNGSELVDSMAAEIDSTTSNEVSVTMMSTTLEPTTEWPDLVTDGGDYEDATELGDSVEREKFDGVHSGSGDEKFDGGLDLEVDYDKEYYLKRNENASLMIHFNKTATYNSEVGDGEIVSEGVEESKILSSEGNGENDGQSVLEAGGEQEFVDGYGLGDEEDFEESNVGVKGNRTNQDEVISVSQAATNIANTQVNAPFKINLGLFDDSNVRVETSNTDTGFSDVLKVVNGQSQTFLGSGQSVLQQSENQPDSIAPQQSVHVVYPHPVFKVSDSQKPQSQSQSSIEPIPTSKLKDSIDFQPSPLQIHNLNSQNQMPAYVNPLEPAPQNPSSYGGFRYPPLPPLAESRPSLPYRPPQPEQHPQVNQNHNAHSSFVRFPADSVPPHLLSYPPPHRQDEEVNTVRFPQDDGRNNDKYSRWGGQQNNNWRFDEGRNRRPEQRIWPGRQESRYPQTSNRRNYWVNNWPNRRRPQPSLHY